MKGFAVVTDNDWSNKGTRRRAQGERRSDLVEQRERVTARLYFPIDKV
jgi:hypothetical protein